MNVTSKRDACLKWWHWPCMKNYPAKAEHEEQRGQIEKLLQNLLDKDGYIEDLEDDLTDMAVKDKQLMGQGENERLSTAIDALKGGNRAGKWLVRC